MEKQDACTRTKKESLKEIKNRLKINRTTRRSSDLTDFVVENVYEKAEEACFIIRKQTGICFDDKMTLHKCEWDENYPENPERYTSVVNRCKELGLFHRCVILPYENITKEAVINKHTEDLYNTLKEINIFNLEEMENESAKYDAVYINKNTFECASIAAGCVMSVVKNVCTGVVQNGMAIVRPPGHHAMANEYCGYCFFNNVAIAAQYALDNDLAKRILIVDYDVHHGQATQQMFYEDDRVLYFSIHRYENGTFWPNLRESNFDYIGAGKGCGYNINFPLNATGMNDVDYLAIVFHILLPVAYEYNPDLILFSAGYDASIGCPEGEMRITPGFYGHLITLLSGLANGKLAVCLEGGYFLPSLAEGVAMTLKSLLDDAPAQLNTEDEIHECITDVIDCLRIVLCPYWKCFQIYDIYGGDRGLEEYGVAIKYLGVPPTPPHDTRNCYAVKDEESIKADTETILALKENYVKLKNGGVCYSYDDVMLQHDSSTTHPENSQRLKKLYERFVEINLNTRCDQVPSAKVDVDTLKLVHDEAYINSLFNNYEPKHSDIYFNSNSINSILTATGCLLSVVDAVMIGPYKSGAALIRPPGHHAEHDEAQGFCFISNVAVAAKHILRKGYAKRILIIDFDIHHGNGTQNAFYDSKDVLYISIHKYDNAKFFPYKTDANFDKVGTGEGTGFNVNIPFNKGKKSDTDYITIFHKIVLPISYSYSPDVIIVSAGFDAGVKDTIGNYTVSPEAFGHFIQLLKPLAMGKLILSLEGGYNVNTLAYSMNTCIKVLLGDPLPMLRMDKISSSTITTIEKVVNCQKEYWPILKITNMIKTKSNILTGVESLKVA